MGNKSLSKHRSPDANRYQLTILVLDSDKKSRAFIVELIRAALPDAMIDEAGTAAKAIVALGKKHYTFFFVGFGSSSHAELSAIRIAKNSVHSPHICVISNVSDEKSVFLAITNGASGYIWKSDPASELKRLLDITLEGGGAAMSGVIASTLIAFMHKNGAVDPPVMSKLTPKESQIINLAAKGHNFKEISSLMNLKMSTIYTHVRHIYEKLQATSISQALNIAREQGLIRGPFSRL
jgi:DNA-binding NarL/FixJ family response regulator